MNIRKYFHIPRSVFFSWLLSYVLIMAVSLIICTFAYWESIKVIKSETSRVYMASLKQLQQVVDSRLRDIERVGVEASLNDRISSLVTLKSTPDENKRIGMVNIVNDLRAFKDANGLIDKFYIYFKYNNFIIASSGTISPEDFYSSYYKGYGFEYETWKNLIDNRHSLEYIALANQSQKNDFKTNVLFMQSLPMTQRNSNDATLVVEMSGDTIQKVIEELNIIPNGTILIKDKNDNILASTKSLQLPQNLNYDKMTKAQDILYCEINSKNMAVSYIKSDVTDWKYISIIPESVFSERVVFIYRIFLACVILCLIIGVLIAYKLAKWNYNPVSKLISLFNIKPEAFKVSQYNEYHLIEKSIMEVIDEKEKVYNKLDMQMDVLKNNFLSRIIKGQLKNNVSFQDACQSYNISLKHKYYAIILIYIEDYSNLYYEDHRIDTNSEDAVNIVHRVLKDIIETKMREKYVSYMTIVNDMPVCLINLCEEELNNVKQELSRLLLEAKNLLEKDFSICFTAAISCINTTIEGIPRAYQEAIEVMEYKILIGNNKIIYYDEISFSKNKKSNESNYIYEEQQFMNCIKAGDYKNAKVILIEIFKTNFSETFPSIQVAKCRMFGLINIMINIIGEVSATWENRFIDDLNIANQLLSCKTIVELQNKMIYILDKVEGHICEKKGNENNELIGKITSFIENNYSNSELSVSMIADEFNMNVVGISKFFKKHSGLGMLDYIHKLRIEKAKALIKDEKLSIKDIGEMVGFYNSASFIRVFKKYEGTTPGRHKETF